MPSGRRERIGAARGALLGWRGAAAGAVAAAVAAVGVSCSGPGRFHSTTRFSERAPAAAASARMDAPADWADAGIETPAASTSAAPRDGGAAGYEGVGSLAMRPRADATAPRDPAAWDEAPLLERRGSVSSRLPTVTSGDALLGAIGSAPPDVGEALLRFRGLHRFAYRSARHYFLDSVRRQAKDTMLLEAGGELLIRYREEVDRAAVLVAEHEAGERFPTFALADAMAESPPPRPRAVTTIGSRVTLLRAGPLRLDNDLHLVLAPLDVDIYRSLHGDPVGDWDDATDGDGTPIVAASAEAEPYGSREGAEARGTLAMRPIRDSGVPYLGGGERDGGPPEAGAEVPPSPRRRLIAPGNLYTGDRASVSASIRVRLHRENDVLDTLASSSSVRVTAVVHGGPHHRPIFRVLVEARGEGADGVRATLTWQAFSF